MIIYKVLNKINGKEYIGQTVGSLKIRKRKHISAALRNPGTIYFHKAIRKYGIDNFKWEILTECDTIEELNRLEIHYIKLYNTFNNGYNLTLGGNGSVGCIQSEVTKRKLSLMNKGKDSPRARAVIINDKYFDTMTEAGNHLNIVNSTVYKRIKRQVPGYQYA